MQPEKKAPRQIVLAVDNVYLTWMVQPALKLPGQLADADLTDGWSVWSEAIVLRKEKSGKTCLGYPVAGNDCQCIE